MSLRRPALLCAAAVWMLLVHMVLLSGAAPVIRRVSVVLPGWPAGEAPLRIALVSDLHTAWPGDRPARLRQTMARLGRERPDLLVVAGDILSNDSLARGYPPGGAAAPLDRVHARLGCVAVPGNHDYAQLAAVHGALAAVGCRMLDNEVARYGPFAVIGIADALRGHPDLPGTLARAHALGGIPILVTHNPAPIYALPAQVPLALAGHTHCGQVKLPLLGVVWHEDSRRRYECGVVREPGRGLVSVIGAGLGSSNLPIRFNVPPDLWIVTVGG